MTVFERPVGASADVSELEYIAALHQTDASEVRTDGSIKAIDIVNFLSSRYGIRVTPAEVTQTILRGLGGGDGNDEVIDVAETVAILLIPELVKAAHLSQIAGQSNASGGPMLRKRNRDEFKSEWEFSDYERRYELAKERMPNSEVIGKVLEMILHDVTGSSEPRPLTRQLVRDIFASYGEHELVDDNDVIDEMIAAAGGAVDASPAEVVDESSGQEEESRIEEEGDGGTTDQRQNRQSAPPTLLDANAFARALTRDVQLYDVESETRITTHYYDVFGTHYSTKLDIENVGGPVGSALRCLGRVLGCGTPMRQDGRRDDVRGEGRGGGRGGGGAASVTDEIMQVPSNDDVFWERGSMMAVASSHRDEVISAEAETTKAKSKVEEFVDNGQEGPPQDEECPAAAASKERGDSGNDGVRGVQRIFTFAAIDSTAGTYRSKAFIVLLWVCAVATYFAYLWDFEVQFGRLDCDPDGFGCRILQGIVNWFVIMLELSILGSIFICFSSLGNSIFSTHKIASIVSMGAVAIFTIVPFATETENQFVNTVHSSDAGFQLIYYISLILGCILLVMQGTTLVRSFLPRKVFEQNPRLARFFAPPIAVAELQMKQAASYKMKNVLQNAANVHPAESAVKTSHNKMVETSYGRALLNYRETHHSEHEEGVGSIAWVWRKFRSGKLYNQEGIFLSSQIIAGNAAQIIVCLFIAVFAVWLFIMERNNFEDVQDEEFFSAFAPKRWMVLLSTTVGLSLGLISAIFIATVYMPSTISTTLQFRSGVIPTLRDKRFIMYRFAEDQNALIFGSIFWGAFYTAFAVAIFFGSIMFLFVWQVTSKFFLGVLANICGLCITLLVKSLVLMMLRQTFYAAFYRKKPAEANFMGVVLESWNIALATGIVLGRGLMLMLATAINIGRIDRPFLSPDVGRFGISKMLSIQMDSYPITFRKAILCSEAHRHPYLERLGCMYMMKLRYGDRFARTSGSIWRLLFVFALMPWLRKYRISTRPELEDDNDEFESARWKTGRVLPKPKKRYSVAEEALKKEMCKVSETDQCSDDIDDLRSENKELKEEVERLRKRVIFVSKARLRKHEGRDNEEGGRGDSAVENQFDYLELR